MPEPQFRLHRFGLNNQSQTYKLPSDPLQGRQGILGSNSGPQSLEFTQQSFVNLLSSDFSARQQQHGPGKYGRASLPLRSGDGRKCYRICIPNHIESFYLPHRITSFAASNQNIRRPPPITPHLSRITYHLSPITYHLSPITYHLSSIIHNPSSIIYHLSFVLHHGLNLFI